jgi:peptide deformylase
VTRCCARRAIRWCASTTPWPAWSPISWTPWPNPGRAGLAANQIGSSLAVFSYNVDGQLGYVINPRVVELRDSIDWPEACLSVPGISAIRTRAEYAVVEGVDLGEEPVVVAGAGGFARCLQHETDHLRGKLYIDDLTGAERRRVMRHLTAPA